MSVDSLYSLIDPKTFGFQFFVTLISLFVLTKLLSWVGYTATAVGTATILLFRGWKITKLIRRFCFRREMLSADNKAVLITGCSSGFGHELAKRLNNSGYTVFAGCRDPAGTGPQELLRIAANPKATKLLKMDVTSDADVSRVLEEVTATLNKEGHQLWAIVNNAGIAATGHVEWGSFEDYYKIFEVNTFGMARVTRAFLPLIRRSQGRVVNVTSMASRFAPPNMSIYAMSKHAAVAFSASLRAEMRAWGVKVCTIEPAVYKTEMANYKIIADGAKKVWKETSESVRQDYGQEYFDSMVALADLTYARNPEEVVDAMFDAIATVKPRIAYRVCGLDFLFLWTLIDFLPYSILDWLVAARGKMIPKRKPMGAQK